MRPVVGSVADCFIASRCNLGKPIYSFFPLAVYNDKLIRPGSRDDDPTFFSLDPDPAPLKKNPDPDPTPDPTFIRNEEKKKYSYFR